MSTADLQTYYIATESNKWMSFAEFVEFIGDTKDIMSLFRFETH